MDFIGFLLENGVIKESQAEELRTSESNGKKVGNIIVKKHILPYNDVVRYLSAYASVNNVH